MKKKILFLIFVVLIFLYGCTNNTCETGLYTGEGDCCNYVCGKECPNGYQEGSCGCECEESGGEVPSDTNIDGIFDSDGGISPPVLPSP
jgi:hypothetical protein